MTVLVLGANGATGFNVVKQLLKEKIDVKAVTRNEAPFVQLKGKDKLEVIKASILKMDDDVLNRHIGEADAVISCLGHNLSFKGIFGKPHKLVCHALQRVTDAVYASDKKGPVKVILMNTTACLNRVQEENFNGKESFVMVLMRSLLPPQRDNEEALEHLIRDIGVGDKKIQWAAVRPDTLIDEDEVSAYTLHASTIRSPIFDPGKTSRINVAHFMTQLVKDDNIWTEWVYKTPVIYNKE